MAVVSGLAYGIDTFAHRGCLDGGGKTVAVLGTQINKIYPSCNRGLAERIVQNGGAILSEYGPEDSVSRKNFTYRNRIVSGLADALVIVEANSRSGTVSTANYANNQGRSVFVVPGDIGREASVGANRLIMDGAGVFVSVDDMMDSIYSQWRTAAKAKAHKKYSSDVLRILKMLGRGSASIDSLAEKLRVGIQELCMKLSLLELDGEVKSDSSGKWSLAH